MAFDAYLNIAGIKGDCTDKSHEGQIKIISFGHSVAQKLSGDVAASGYRTGGGCEHGYVSFSKQLDLASPVLYQKCSAGDNLDTAEFSFYRAAGTKTKYLTVKLSNVNIANISVRQDQGMNFPEEVVELAYQKIEWTYTGTDSTGKPTGDSSGSWDLGTNTT